jgi:hypothetical protein
MYMYMNTYIYLYLNIYTYIQNNNGDGDGKEDDYVDNSSNFEAINRDLDGQNDRYINIHLYIHAYMIHEYIYMNIYTYTGIDVMHMWMIVYNTYIYYSFLHI